MAPRTASALTTAAPVALAGAVVFVVALVVGGLAVAEARGAGGRAAAARAVTKKRGKVVRIERAVSPTRRPQVCQIYGQNTGYCFGDVVEPGDGGTVVDENGHKAEVRIKDAVPQPDPCGNVSSWNVTLDVVSGDLDNLTGQTFLLLDVAAGPWMRSMPYGSFQLPAAQAGENLWIAFDDGSDGVADFVVTYYQCDANGVINTSATTSGFCMNYYALRGSDYARVRQDQVRQCQ